jgi:anti-sigma regulatory factor (Ser/Thr protein kinase)
MRDTPVNATTNRERRSEVYPAEAMSVRQARQFAVGSAEGTGVDPAELAMAVSELASNSVLHARTSFEVCVERLADGVRVEVRDESAVLPVARMADPAAVTGRGLAIVESVSRAWGADPTADGKVVWFEIGSVDHDR